MKTSEDKLNEALRDVLKRKFDDYEEQPNANALERIRARVKPARTGRYWWFTGKHRLGGHPLPPGQGAHPRGQHGAGA